MYAYCTYIGRNTWDVLVWTSQAASQNDDDVTNAIDRATVTASMDDRIGSIRRMMGLDDSDMVEFN